MTAIAVKPTRIRNLNTAEIASGGGGVTYWMGRDARVQDNWALLHAAELAAKHGLPLSVVYCMPPPSGPEATLRRYDFLLGGLAEVEAELGGLGVPFRLLRGAPALAFHARRTAAHGLGCGVLWSVGNLATVVAAVHVSQAVGVTLREHCEVLALDYER